jgi:hypothetical protein
VNTHFTLDMGAFLNKILLKTARKTLSNRDWPLGTNSTPSEGLIT